MNSEILLSFALNILILMSLAVIYSIFPYESKLRTIYKKIIMGLIVAGIGITVMYSPFELMEGLYFDARAVVISVAAMFLGLVPTIIGSVTLILYRIYLGGDGAITGVLWVIFAAVLGLLWRHLRLKNPRFKNHKITWIELYLVGFIIQVVMVTLLLTLPHNMGPEVISEVAFSLLIIFPIGSLLISEFMLTQRLRFFQHIKTKDSENQYKKLFNDSAAMIILFDPITGDIEDVNQAAIDRYGYTYEEFTRITIFDINVKTIEAVKKSLLRAKNEEQEFFSLQHQVKDKSIIDVEIHSGPMMVNDKELLLSSVFDVTEKLENERQFKDVDNKLRATLLSVGEGIVVTDSDHVITLINDNALQLLGDLKKPLGKRICDVFRIYSEQSSTAFKDIFHESLEQNKIYKSSVTYKLLRNDNDNECYVDFSISPIKIEGDDKFGAILVIRDETIEEERKNKIKFISQHDYLTGLYNRYFFEDQISRLNTKRQLPLTIIMGDVNGLKLLNDAFSHVEGDKLLIEIANILKKATRQEDILSRWGGDEFAILLPQTTIEDTKKVYARIKDLCNKSMYETITPSISLGFAAKETELENIDDVIKLAEQRMYHEKLVEGKKMRNDLVEALENKLYERSSETKEHADNLEKYCEILGREIGIESQGLKLLKQSARFHDIGLIGLDSYILTKEEPLDEHEWDRIKAHPEIGSRIVQSISELQHISKEILHHHERWDGTGYPQQLSRENIPYLSRIISVLDAYDVMTSGRIYKEKISKKEAIQEIKNCSGTQFDPEIVDAFLRVFKG